MKMINQWVRTSRFAVPIMLSSFLFALAASGVAGAVSLQSVRQTNSIPTMISYQGRVFVGNEAFSGTGSFKFAIVDTETGDGSTNYWANDGTAIGEPATAVSIEVDFGLFNVLLGDTTLGGMTQGITEAVFQNNPAYLRVWFSHTGDIGSYQALEPNQRIVSAPYALHAQVAETAGDSDTVDGYHAGSSPASNQLIALDSASHLNVSRLNDSDMPDFYVDPWGTSVLDHIDLRGNLFNEDTNYVNVVDNIRANRFIDRTSTGFYTDPGTTSILNYIDLRGNLHNEATSYVTVEDDIRADRYVDRNNTSYYVDPWGTSVLDHVDLRGNLFNNDTNYVTVVDDIHANAFVDRDDPGNYWVNPTGISIFNNLYWTGHLQGIEVSPPYFAQSDSEGAVTTTMVPADNSVCFLVGAEYAELDYMTEFGECSVYTSGGYWVLEAYTSDYPASVCYASCRGQCILW
jgi:hypothetical protein